jgi:DNA-binding NarL/FixJ family response regulator
MPARPSRDALSRRAVFIVDDHPVFREGLVRIINQEADLVVSGEAGDAAEALERIDASRPDLVVIDISLDGMNGLELVKSLRDRRPETRLLVVRRARAAGRRQRLYHEARERAHAPGRHAPRARR